MISLRGLQKYFNKGKQNEIHVINDITLEFPESGMCAIFGPSGCGKTTLLNVIGGLDKYAEGAVEFEGKPLAENTDTIRNQYTGFIFQNYNLNKEETVFENVAAALRLCGMEDEEIIRERVNAALANVGMEKFSKRTPDTLSGGQQQRVAIARALVKNPKVILADEPTGNLDEANTILVMDILKKLSKDHLILLVTHEANLVDFYCDMVIELSDGRVLHVRNNDAANGYVTRDKNTIYLGEYEEHDTKDPYVSSRYFGDAPEEPIQLTVINKNGRILLRVDSERVQIVDSYSEVTIREGVYTEEARRDEKESEIDMSKLPPVEGTRFGRLFRFGSSVRSGYRSNYKVGMQKKSGKMLRNCMVLFAIVIVFMTAVFGTGIRTLLEIKEKYHNSVFYITATDQDIYDRIKAAAADSSSGIRSIWPVQSRATAKGGDDSLSFFAFGFESYQTDGDDFFLFTESAVNASILALPDLDNGMKVVAGSLTNINDDDIVITSAVAKKIIESGSYTYLKEYNNVLGMMITPDYLCHLSGYAFRVRAIVESEDPAVYVTDRAMAFGAIGVSRLNHTVLMDENGEFGVEKGKCTVIRCAFDRNETSFREVIGAGDDITINGTELSISEWLDIYDKYGKQPKQEPSTIGLYDENGRLIGTYQTETDEPDEPDEPDTQMFSQEDLERLKLREKTEEKLVKIRGYNPQASRLLVIVNPEDYVNIGKYLGPTTSCVYFGASYDYYANPRNNPDGDTGKELTDNTAYSDMIYRVLSDNPEATERYLQAHFSDLHPNRNNPETLPVILSPTYFYENIYNAAQSKIVRSLTSEAVVLILMCVCMFFIMKSATMNRIREIGIYRAIGVTKKNVIYKFAVESGVVATLSVLVGYLIASAGMAYLQSKGGFVKDILYYPWWMALIVFVFLYAICIICGIIPILGLVKKTPSEILAKYDI